MIKSLQITSGIKWPRLLIFWAIHGNEKCWTIAINKLLDEINNNKISIKCWQVTFVPICNPEAYKNNERYHEINLNRVFKKYENPEKYEEKLANLLTQYVDDCDYLLDIHSMTSNWTPFVFQDYDDSETEKFAKLIWEKYIVKWWPQMYQELDTSDTIWYAHDNGKIWVLIECGKHWDISSNIVAYNTIINACKYLWIIKSEAVSIDENNFETTIAKKIFFKEKEWKLIKNWNHMDKINKWDIIALYDDWEKIVAEESCYILLPNDQKKLWEEWFYIGQTS